MPLTPGAVIIVYADTNLNQVATATSLTPEPKKLDCHWFFTAHNPWPRRHPLALHIRRAFPSALPLVKAAVSAAPGTHSAKNQCADKVKAKQEWVQLGPLH